MDGLNAITWNVNGLNSPIKRTRCLEFLHSKKVALGIIQETHLKSCDVHRFQNRRYKIISSSCAPNKTKGVLILAARSLPLTVHHTYSDDQGRFTFAIITVGQAKLVVASVYAPNIFDPDFLHFVNDKLLGMPEYNLVIGGDLNCAMFDIDKTTSVADPRLSLALQKFVTELQLVDVWRFHNKSTRNYTFYSNRHKSFSRIDYIFLSQSLVHHAKPDILPILLSDHAPVLCLIFPKGVPQKATRWRFNDSLLLDKNFDTQIRDKLVEFIEINKQGCPNAQILWETVKCFIRGFCISFSSSRNKARKRRLEELESNIKALELELQQNSASTTAGRLKALCSEYKQLNLVKAEFILQRTRQKYYSEGERPSHLLALRLRENDSKANIFAIKDPNGSILTDPASINDVFRKFYLDLYTSEVKGDHTNSRSFLDGLDLPKLSQEEAEQLESPLTLDEVTTALKSLNRGKSPGLDGIPPELLLFLWDIVGPLFLDSMNYALETGVFHRDQNRALISLLLKKGKDPLDCGNFRPISLICCDVKVFAKVIANRLDTFVSKLINHDQTGFLKGRTASDNIRRLFHIINNADTYPESMAVFSLDAMKAYDRLEMPYMWAVLENFGFGPTFLNMIKVLYKSPTACVLTGSKISSPFQLERGTRQGCPLSPILFCLCLEPLAQLIRQSRDVKPVTLYGVDHHISLFADDILLFLSKIESSVPQILKLFEQFGQLSGYKINWDKSILMPLNNTGKSKAPQGIPTKDSFTYLGVHISSIIPQIVKENFVKCLQNIQIDIKRWNRLPLSLQGRVNIVKMNILPRINFLFFMIPLAPPPNYYKDIHSSISQFIWNGKRPRIKLKTLQRPKLLGGLALPNFQFYHWAFQIRALHIWMDPSSKVPWRSIEEAMVKPHRLEDLLFTGLGRSNTNLKFGCIIAHSLKVWKEAEKCMGVPLHTGALTPLWHNSRFLIGGKPFHNSHWFTQGIHVVNDMFDGDGLRSFQNLKVTFNLPGSSYFVYLQLRSALKAYGVPWDRPPISHSLLRWVQPSNNLRGRVSLVYNALLHKSAGQLAIEKIWDRELSTHNQELDWDEIWMNLSQSSKNLAHQLIHYKTIHRAYATPYRKFRMNRAPSSVCNICNTLPGTFLHMFWECPIIVDLWSSVVKDLSKLLDISIPNTPHICLLNDFTDLEYSIIQQRMIMTGFTAAKKVILHSWIHPQVPPRKLWLNYLDNIVNLEYHTARVNRAMPSTLQKWQSFLVRIQDLNGRAHLQ